MTSITFSQDECLNSMHIQTNRYSAFLCPHHAFCHLQQT